MILNITNNETDLRYTKRDNILREVATNLDLNDLDLIKSSEQVEMENKQFAEQEERMRQFEMDIAWLKAKSGGHVGNDNDQGIPADEGAESNMPEGQQL
jgi:uncharacterized protein (DUF3084 family)